MGKRIVKITVGVALVTLLALGGRQVYVTTYADTKTPTDTETLKQETSNSSEPLIATEDIPTVVIDNDGIKTGKEKFDAFMKGCNNKKSGSLRIKYEYDFAKIYEGSEYINADEIEPLDDVCVKFDGKSYYYFGRGIKQKYKYLFKVTGQLPNAARAFTEVVLADEKYSYEQIKKSVYSSNSADHIPYESLFSY